MKMKKQIREALIQELGDTTEAYLYRLDHTKAYNDEFRQNARALYSFQTHMGTNYGVYFRYHWEKSPFVIVQFEADDAGGWSGTVNEGSMFRVIATIMQCASDFWSSRYDVFRRDGVSSEIIDRMKGFRFQTPEGDLNNSARFKLYRTFIKRQFPSAKIRIRGEEALIIP